MKLSLVIPCYNEQDNVELFYNTATEAFKDKGFEYELIFVNDGSRDRTWEIISAAAIRRWTSCDTSMILQTRMSR